MIIPNDPKHPESKELASVGPVQREEEPSAEDGVRPSTLGSSRAILTHPQLPPPYAPQAAAGSSAKIDTVAPPPDLVGVNYCFINQRNSTVRGTYLLDLALPPPPASALPAGAVLDTSEHLKLESHNGSVVADVWVAGSGAEGERARMHFGTQNGSCKVKLYTSPFAARPLLNVRVVSHNGSCTLFLPRSFRGQLTLYTVNGGVQLSPAVAPRAAALANVDNTRTYFLGERPRANKWATGDGAGEGELVDDANCWTKNGGVYVRYNDEPEASFTSMVSSFFKALR
ncbi:hypothetical protein BV25DRAFT_194078 [Artomyces pyxidatus]|uniref:Uncharacterized protein n=1 Tax=Artomyces pyxidatus TaxID=48021 RepID=A0ACB8T9L7_9AGAM|nr:hypothetical protein BV25DRAFT_194078 [Artomyces pyxidatus]